jgi:hypothetical protein
MHCGGPPRPRPPQSVSPPSPHVRESTRPRDHGRHVACPNTPAAGARALAWLCPPSHSRRLTRASMASAVASSTSSSSPGSESSLGGQTRQEPDAPQLPRAYGATLQLRAAQAAAALAGPWTPPAVGCCGLLCCVVLRAHRQCSTTQASSGMRRLALGCARSGSEHVHQTCGRREAVLWAVLLSTRRPAHCVAGSTRLQAKQVLLWRSRSSRSLARGAP